MIADAADTKGAIMIKLIRPRIATLDTRRVRPAPKRGAPLYDTPAWRTLVRQLIAQRGRRCEDPAHDPSRSRSGQIYGDHIIEILDGGAPLDPDNVMLRCPSCHTLKTARGRAARR
jgi:5-methylcytosine-specific restriction protein A